MADPTAPRDPKTPLPEASIFRQPLLGNRFLVTFLFAGVLPNPLDIRFQSVSGLSSEVKTSTIYEGGQNLHPHRLPDRVDHQNLILKRGLVVGSLLNTEFNAAFSTFTFNPSNVLVAVLDENKVPLAGWLFIKAYPVRWATSDLDAEAPSFVIDTLELAYARMQMMRI